MPCSQLTFLVVEDHEFQREMLVQLLRAMGAEAVHTAADGGSALELLSSLGKPVDIIVTDLSMPGMDGMEFIRNLSEIGVRVSLIIASAVESPLLVSISNMAQAYRVRLLGVLTKPVGAAKLAPLVELHRSQQGEQRAPEAKFPLNEIAEAWAHHEIAPWFQPRVDLKGGMVHALHATPRWLHPTLGLLEPDDFMSSVQARGLQDDFAWMMLQKCIVQCRHWRDSGRPIPVYVHLGMQNLAEGKLASRIRRTADNEGLSPGLLVLAISEAALDASDPRLLENLARLRMDGFGLAIDDFGSGAMDLDQLALVSFTEVKVRSSFVSNAIADGPARAGLAVGLELARQLKLAAIADGVSSKEEWALLHGWGCHFGVGPFIAPPMAAAAVTAWLARWHGATIR